MNPKSSIQYKTGNALPIDQVIELYRASTLGARRPVDDKQRMADMIARANLVITAWDGERLVGISRSLSDFCFATYLSDLAVHVDYQKRGVGRELMRLTQVAGGKATIFLFSAPAAVDYYPRVGFKEGKGFMLRSDEKLR